MSSLPIVNMQGADVGAYDLSDDLLEFEKGLQAMQDAVVAHLANRRQGSASTKDKAEVRGSNRKLWKQKGTGRARTGSRRSPIWRSGGVVFGPRPRSYRKQMNRRVSRLAFRRAFSEKVRAEQVTVLEDLSLDQPKTRLMAEVMRNIGVEKNALLLTSNLDGNLALACRNLPDLQLELAANANTYQVMKYHRVLCTREAMQVLEKRLAP